jgi:hypothetical protein
MKYEAGLEVLNNSIFQEVYKEVPENSVTYSKEIRAYKHPEKELFIVIQEFNDSVHFLKAYGTVRCTSKLVTQNCFGSIITHSYDNGQYHGLAAFMDGYRGLSIQYFIDFLDKNYDEFESRMHSLPVMYLQLTAGSNSKKQESILKNLGLTTNNREIYFSVPHALATEKAKKSKIYFDKNLE